MRPVCGGGGGVERRMSVGIEGKGDGQQIREMMN